ncbi:tyrosine-type recombinase/integrase [Actinoplanes subtropicus]|uniref:tyrosine-type recombinase/integrase n=1 Tax=Actinoplanes subtropicus TaxID=543632 RepID=UPI0004C44144|nr:tyrosine-type recombinase/integrase [Actinoplanes subtropicus]
MDTDLSRHLEDYLRLRRSQGFKLVRPGAVLAQFVTWLQAAGATTITVDAAVAWAAGSPGTSPISRVHRLGAVRGFARYLRTIDPATEIPPADVFPRPVCRAHPYLYSPDEIRALLAATRGLRPQIRAKTYEVLLGLIAATGMRLGEAVSLRRTDVDLDAGVLTIGGWKAGPQRLVPLHPSMTKALHDYAQARDRHFPAPRTDSFFVSSVGTPLITSAVDRTFNQLTTTIGIRTETVKPRIHDLRHRFAVARLLDWYQRGQDPAGKLPVLSTYLGHVNPAGTFWYFSAVPELMALAAERLQQGPPR